MIADIEPLGANSMSSPLLLTNFNASTIDIELAATNAEYSPKECPAKYSGLISTALINF